MPARNSIYGTGRMLILLLMLAVFATAATAADNPLRSYADVAEAAGPAVVNISADKVMEPGADHPFMDDPMFRRFFNMPDDDVHNNQERISRSLGSGVVISADGYILTNNHVVENTRKIRVTFQGEKEYEAEIIGTDPQTDVALIKIDAQGLPAVRIANSGALRVGDQVMAIGNPFGVGQTVTLGIVSALGRTIGLIDYEDLIQTDASINPGNSGGALVNMQGELVGMNSAILSRSGGSQGIGFAIPSNMAMTIVQSLKIDGEVKRAYLGVLPQPVDQSMADYYGLDKPRGVLIAQVNDDTPADKSGLKDGDIILAVGGKEIRNPSMLRNTISLSAVGEKVDIDILRDGKEKTVKVELEAFPEVAQANAPAPNRDNDELEGLEGVKVSELTTRMRASLELPDELDGLLVTGVSQASNAAEAGLAQGDLIQEVGRKAVSNIEDFRDELGKNTDRPVFMRVYKPRQQRSVFIAVPR